MAELQKNYDAGADIYKQSQDTFKSSGAWGDYQNAYNAAGSNANLQQAATDTLHGTDSWKQYQKQGTNYANFQDANALLYPSQVQQMPDFSGNLEGGTTDPTDTGYNPLTTNANFTASNYLNQGNTNITGTNNSTGIHGGSRPATQADVDSGLATAIGQQIGSVVSLPEAEADVLKEVGADAQAGANIRLGASEDKYKNLTGVINDIGDEKLNVLAEGLTDANTAANTLVNASDTKFKNIDAASSMVTPLQQAASTEGLEDAGLAKTTLDLANKSRFDGVEVASGLAKTNLDTANQDRFDGIQGASAGLTQAEYDANLAKYKNVTDALRTDRLGAMRAGESTTTGTGDRMRLEAEMQAARNYTDLDNTSALNEAGRTLANTNVLENTGFSNTKDEASRTLTNTDSFENTEFSNTQIVANAQLKDNQTQYLVDQANRTLSSVTASESEKFEAQKIVSDTQYANNLAATKLATKQDLFAQLQEREEERVGIADELATITSSTQEQTLPAVKLAELAIEQAIAEGNLEVQSAEEKYQATIEKAKELLSNPSLMETLSNQLEGEQITLGSEYNAEQQQFLNRINNLKNIKGLIDEIKASVGENMFAAYTAAYGEYGAIWAAGVASGHVDMNGLPMIPTNSFGMTNTPENTIDASQASLTSTPGEESETSLEVDNGTLKVTL